MRFIGHVSTAVIVSSPLIYFRGNFPAELSGQEMSNFQLLWWVGLFGVLPDIDIILSRFTPIKHRGFLSHSLYTAIIAGGLVFGAYWFLARDTIHFKGWLATLKTLNDYVYFFNPLTSILTFVAILAHLIGDSLTKTGVPLLRPKGKWHFPIIGGHVAFDSYALNMIPLVFAGYIVYAVFGFDETVLRKLGKLSDVTGFFKNLFH